MLDATDDPTLGKAFVRRDYEPANMATTDYVDELAQRLGLVNNKTKPSSILKNLRCISDLLMACRNRHGELICWSMNKNDYDGPPYTHRIAEKVLGAAIREGILEKASRGEKGKSACYRVCLDVPKELSFHEHGLGPVLEVRAAKPNMKSHQPKKGRKVALKKFGDAYKPLLEEVKAINRLMGLHPLKGADGESWASCKRVFNNGRLDSGGRLYGGWQHKNSEERLGLTIDDEPVCEIDIKACYLFIANAVTGNTVTLSQDPYSNLPFVREVNCPARRKEMRDAFKVFILAYLSSGCSRKQFPILRDKAQNLDANGKIKSFKEKYGLGRKVKATDWVNMIAQEYPFLSRLNKDAGELMYLESQIMVTTLLSLANLDIPAYPVHDCLLCKEKDKNIVVDGLQRAMIAVVGCQGYLDIEYWNKEAEIIEPDPKKADYPTKTTITPQWHSMDWGIDDEDYDVLEDY